MQKSGRWRGPAGAVALFAAGCVPMADEGLVVGAPSAVPATPVTAVAVDTAPPEVAPTGVAIPSALPVLPGPAFDGLPATLALADGMAAVMLVIGDGGADLVLVAPGLPAGEASCSQVALDAYTVAAQSPPANIQVHFVFPQPSTPDETIVALTTAQATIGAAPAGVVNLGACDGADGIGVWDADGPAERSLVMDALIQAGDSEGVATGFASRPAAAPTHHRAFQAAGVPAVGLTLPDGDTAQSTRLLVRVVDVFDAFVGGAVQR